MSQSQQVVIQLSQFATGCFICDLIAGTENILNTDAKYVKLKQNSKHLMMIRSITLVSMHLEIKNQVFNVNYKHPWLINSTIQLSFSLNYI